jgi:hypothetical protein
MARKFVSTIILFGSAAALWAQPVSVGVKGGIPLTDAFTFGSISSGGVGVTDSDTYFSKTKRYTVGPTIEFHLPAHLSVEFDALYKHLNYDRTFFEETPSNGRLGSAIQNVLGRWEFPLLLKYKPWSNRLGPYIAAGPTLNYISGNHSVIELFHQTVFGPPTSPTTTTSNALPVELRRIHTGGVAVAAGLQFRLLHLRLSPEVRYTRWVNPNFLYFIQVNPKILRSDQNQVEVLVGLTFP